MLSPEKKTQCINENDRRLKRREISIKFSLIIIYHVILCPKFALYNLLDVDT